MFKAYREKRRARRFYAKANKAYIFLLGLDDHLKEMDWSRQRRGEFWRKIKKKKFREDLFVGMIKEK